MQPRHEVLVSGALLLAFGQACVNLNFYIEEDSRSLIQNLQPTEWYPLETFTNMLHIVVEKYSDPAPILEQIGIEMMNFWYNIGPGKQYVKRGVDFLRFQTSSEGYYSVIRGDPNQIGEFTLRNLDEQEGIAIVRSTTPFNKHMERGILIGGLGLAQDLIYISVDNSVDAHTFLIEFH